MNRPGFFKEAYCLEFRHVIHQHISLLLLPLRIGQVSQNSGKFALECSNTMYNSPLDKMEVDIYMNGVQNGLSAYLASELDVHA